MAIARMFEGKGWTAAQYDDLIAKGMTAQPRWGMPEDVARVIRTMAAGLLPYTVAQEVRVDGGLLIQRF